MHIGEGERVERKIEKGCIFGSESRLMDTPLDGAQTALQ